MIEGQLWRAQRQSIEKIHAWRARRSRVGERWRSAGSFGLRHIRPRPVKGLRVAGAKTLEQANAYLEAKCLPWWNAKLTGVPASAYGAHRPLAPGHSLPASLSMSKQTGQRLYDSHFHLTRPDKTAVRDPHIVWNPRRKAHSAGRAKAGRPSSR
jgi:hypothetical protein